MVLSQPVTNGSLRGRSRRLSSPTLASFVLQNSSRSERSNATARSDKSREDEGDEIQNRLDSDEDNDSDDVDDDDEKKGEGRDADNNNSVSYVSCDEGDGGSEGDDDGSEDEDATPFQAGVPVSSRRRPSPTGYGGGAS